MKYVIMAMQKDGQTFEFPIIFPETLVHKDIGLYMMAHLAEVFDIDHSKVGVSSAGFISSTAINGKMAGGKSDSLNISSMPSDGEFIKCNDYCANIRDNAATVGAMVELALTKQAVEGGE